MSAHKILLGLVLLSLFSLSWASTICTTEDCKITITIKIAFSGANDTYIQNAENEIEDVWNGPNGQTYGDCKCPVTFEVETKKITNASQVNCNPGPPGYHCVMVTDYNNNPPRNQTNMTGATFYIGYMYGIATGNGGNSQKGWWSNIMSRPVPGSTTGEHYVDFAHEAGHMMGLEDGDGGIMNVTSGPDARPTQDNINKVVEGICGANACPDRCCCGNGVVDKDKGEECDPMAEGDSCPKGEYCCPVCCHCWGTVCFPGLGEYADKQECESSCSPNAKCYYNYQTGCWDCVVHEVVVEEPQYDKTRTQQIAEDDHTRQENAEGIRNLYEKGYEEGQRAFPYLAGFFADEVVNFNIGGENYHMVLSGGEIAELEGGEADNPTFMVTADAGTIEGIDAGMLSPLMAFREGMITIEGAGFFEKMKLWLVTSFVDVFVPHKEGALDRAVAPGEGAGGEAPPEEGTKIREDVPAMGGDFPEGEIPEDILKVETE